MKIDPKLTVEEIARRWPATATVLAKYRIDLCCGGKHTLEFVALKHKVELTRLLHELEAAVVSPAPR
jgi:iron-sulfur cluster repair protein YtfE (RIC family)